MTLRPYARYCSLIESYALIVGLLSAYSSGRDLSKAIELAEFNKWLIEHNHQDVIDSIEHNLATSVFIKAYLNRELPQIQFKLDSIEGMVRSLVSSNNDEQPNPHILEGQYAKGVVTLFFEHSMIDRLTLNDFDNLLEQLAYLMEGEGLKYDNYVLETMVRECLQKKGTPSDVVNKHWFMLLN